MTTRLLWLPSVLVSAGLKVAETDDWQTRGGDGIGPTLGVICHHTANATSGNMPSLPLLIVGREDLAGPLCQLGLGRDGTFYLVASGRANHAGLGVWNGITTGNTNFIGIEAEHSGRDADKWPEVQMDAYQRGVAAILGHVGRSAASCCGHKEFARPLGRKTDPTFVMNDFRQTVTRILTGAAPAPVLIPAKEAGDAGRPTLRRGASGTLVAELQRLLKMPSDVPVFGPKTEAAMRAFQRAHALVPDGIVGPKSWAALDASARPVR